jgi:hypothetical protein
MTNKKGMSDFKQWLKTISPELKQVLKRLPGIIKVEGLDFIHDNFEQQGFEKTTGNYDKWKPRKPVKWKKAEQRNQGRAILVKTGNLQRSWDSNSKAGIARVEFASDKPYAEPHNEGSKVHPQRQMIGDSAALDARVEAKINRLMNSIFK